MREAATIAGRFRSRDAAALSLTDAGWTAHDDGSFTYLQATAYIDDVAGGVAIRLVYAELQDTIERGQCLIEEGIHRRRIAELRDSDLDHFRRHPTDDALDRFAGRWARR